MSEYSDRLKLAMQRVNVDVPAIAKALSISYTAAKKAFDGKSTFTAANNAAVAHFLQVDSDWLATGKGDPVRSKGEPFRDLDVFEGQLVGFFRKLTPDQQHEVVVALNQLVEHGEPAGSAAAPFKKAAAKHARGMSVFGELDELPADKKSKS